MDFFFWGGPVYCDTATKVQWQRPTYVFCHPLDGAKNVDYAAQLTAAGSGSPLSALLATAEAEAQRKGIPFKASEVGTIGLGGFSAAHQLINPILKVDADRARVSYVHLADSCFLGAGATSPHVGYSKFAAEASNPGSGKMMTVTSNGPRGNIHYFGPDGTEYNLTSGSSCVQLFWDEASRTAGHYGWVDQPAEVPPGVPQPTESHRVGNLIWMSFDRSEHGDHTNKWANPMMQFYGAPHMAQVASRLSLGNLGKLGGPMLVGAAALLAYWYVRNRDA